MSEEGITVLTGEAKAAARGELHGDIHLNVAARDAALGVADAVYETKEYSDGTVATGVAPLPELSPAQQDAEMPALPAPEPTVETIA